MGRGCAIALAAAAAALPMLLVLPPDADTYEQESRRMFVEWKARYKKTYKYAGEEECRYALFKESRCRVAWARADGVTTSGLNGLSALANEEIQRGYRVRKGEKSYEQETRRMFVGWKAKYGKTYRDVGEEECRYRLFKGNRRVVVRLNAGQNVYGINQFGDLTNEEVRERCYPEMVDQELSARCQAAAPDPDPDHGRRIWYQGMYPFGEYISYTNQSLTIHEIKHLWRKHRCARTYGRDLNIRVDIFENPAETNVLCSDWNGWKDPIIWFDGATDAVGIQFFLENVHPRMKLLHWLFLDCQTHCMPGLIHLVNLCELSYLHPAKSKKQLTGL